MDSIRLFLITYLMAYHQISFSQSFFNHKNQVIAHRGAWKAKNLPQNSIASLRNAIDLKCTGSEFDVHMTSDGVLIINHDDSIRDLLIENHTFDELNQYRLRNGENYPTLVQYLAEGLKNNEGTRLICEIKPCRLDPARGITVAQKVYDEVSRVKAQEVVTYISFDLKILTTLVSINDAVHCQYLNGDKSPDELKALGIDGVDYHFSVFKTHPDWIIQAKTNQQTLNVWTVNKEEDMQYFIEANFDQITTNEPEKLLLKLKK